MKKLLCTRGASLNASASFGTTPLHYAAEKRDFWKYQQMILFFNTWLQTGFVEVTKVLLDCGANINIIDDSSSIPLHATAQKGTSEHNNKNINRTMRTIVHVCIDISHRICKFGRISHWSWRRYQCKGRLWLNNTSSRRHWCYIQQIWQHYKRCKIDDFFFIQAIWKLLKYYVVVVQILKPKIARRPLMNWTKR